VNGQLAQVLRYLERDGVTEVVLCAGQPIAMRTANGLTNVTARPLSSEQLVAMLRDTALAKLVGPRGQDEVLEFQAGTRRVVARVTRRDDVIAVTLTRAAPPAPPPIEPPTEPPLELDFELATEPPVEYEIDLATEPPVRRSVVLPPPARVAAGPSPMPEPPPLGPGIELDLSFDDVTHDLVAHSSPPATDRIPGQRDRDPVFHRIAPRAGSDHQDRQDTRPASSAFQRVDLRDARAPTPKPDPVESAEDSSAWADIDLAPPSGKR